MPVEDGVVGAEADGAVVGEDEVGDAAEGFLGFLVGVADGGAGGVAAGHDEEFWHLFVEAVRVAEEEHVEGGVGEEEAEGCGVGGDGGGDGARGAGFGARGEGGFLFEEEDGFLVAGEEGSLGVFFDDGDLFDGGKIAGHEGEGFCWAVFARAEAFDGRFVGGVAGEVEAADAFEGEDLAADEGAAGSGDRGGKGGGRGRGGRFEAREENFGARGRQGGPTGFHGRFLNGILAGPPCRRVGMFVVAE